MAHTWGLCASGIGNYRFGAYSQPGGRFLTLILSQIKRTEATTEVVVKEAELWAAKHVEFSIRAIRNDMWVCDPWILAVVSLLICTTFPSPTLDHMPVFTSPVTLSSISLSDNPALN
jgi:hypothetical protein